MPVKTDESSNIISHGFDSPILSIFSYPQGAVKKLAFFLQPLCLLQIDFYKFRFSLIVPLWEPLCPLCMRALR